MRHYSQPSSILTISYLLLLDFHQSTFSLAALTSSTPACSLSLHDRVDCYPEGGSTAEGCTKRGCDWCPLNNDLTSGDFPWCVYPAGQLACPSIAEKDKIDCHPDAFASKANCLARGCHWCETNHVGSPFCIYNSTGWPTINTSPKHRVDCAPEGVTTPESCSTRGCIYGAADENGPPYCFIPYNYGYRLAGTPIESDQGIIFNLTRFARRSLFGDDSDEIQLKVEYQTEDRVRILISDGTQRWQVPIKTQAQSTPVPEKKRKYAVTFATEPVFAIKVIRKESGTVLFDTSFGGLTISDQFLQISTHLPSRNVYGFGEQGKKTLKQDLNWKSYSMYSLDQAPTVGLNVYGVHPYYQVIENDGNSHSVLFLNSNAQEAVFTPTPALIYRTIGGVIDAYIFLGPSPEEVAQQYTEAIGRYYIPPYWTLGFHICRWGYGSTDNLRAVHQRMEERRIPYDGQWTDIDIFDSKLDFTLDDVNFAGLPDYIRDIRRNGTHFVIILDPAITTGRAGHYPPYDKGNELDVWVKKSNGEPVIGRVWPDDPLHFPDFFNNNTHLWWKELIMDFHKELPFDGLWIDMNEPSNFENGDMYEGCANNKINNPPYIPRVSGSSLYYKTLCPDHKHAIGNHYDLHSLYGWSETEPSLRALRETIGKRGFVLSRSTFPSSGRWTAHWLGDNWSAWSGLAESITGILSFSQFGIPMVGADICGFGDEAEEEMCTRWHQLGAFYPFSRNHNTLGSRDQDPAIWSEESSNSSRRALEIRYTILPYLYTLFYNHYKKGSTVARPLWNEFPTDPYTLDIDRQFLLGPAFLVSPVLEQGVNYVEAYFPPASRWYSYYNGLEVINKGIQTISAPLDFIPLHIRGGHILPTQKPGMNTVESRKNNLGLIIALDENGKASGSLFIDDGESIGTVESGEYYLAKFKVSDSKLTSRAFNHDYPNISNVRFDEIRVLGLDHKVTNVKVNGQRFYNYTYDRITKELVIRNVNLNPREPFNIKWAPF